MRPLDQGTDHLLTEHLRALIPHGAVQCGLDISASKERKPKIMELRAKTGQQAYLYLYPLGEINPI